MVSLNRLSAMRELAGRNIMNDASRVNAAWRPMNDLLRKYELG